MADRTRIERRFARAKRLALAFVVEPGALEGTERYLLHPTGGAPITFRGFKLAEGSTRKRGVEGGTTRWHTLTVYMTPGQDEILLPTGRGYPPAPRFADLQRRLLEDLRAKYRAKVSEIVAAVRRM